MLTIINISYSYCRIILPIRARRIFVNSFEQKPSNEKTFNLKKWLPLIVFLSLVAGAGLIFLLKKQANENEGAPIPEINESAVQQEAATGTSNDSATPAPGASGVEEKGNSSPTSPHDTSHVETPTEVAGNSLAPNAPVSVSEEKLLKGGIHLETKAQHAASEPPQCYSVEFTHKKLASHATGAMCMNHKNLVALDGAQINNKTICIRVNGRPVEHKLIKSDRPENKGQVQVLFGSVAGPNSVVTATYCTKTAKCNEGCRIPRDEFMEAIGGGDDSLDGDLPTVTWHAGGKQKITHDEESLDKEVAQFSKALGAGNDAKGKGNVFIGWIQQETKNSCWKESNSLNAQAETKR